MIADLPIDDCCLFLDVDGSLIDIAARPDQVFVPPGLVRDLQAATNLLGGALALVSGRSIAQLDSLFAPARLRASGVHGAEIRFDPQASTLTMPGDVLPSDLWDEVTALLDAFPGTLAENKRFSFAIHYRAVPDVGPALMARLGDLASGHAGSDIRLMPGHFVIEMKRATFNKGIAVERFMTEPRFASRKPVFVGDDVTDLPGFAAALRCGGEAYCVGPRLPGTTGAFEGPADVRRWIGRIAATERLHA